MKNEIDRKCKAAKEACFQEKCEAVKDCMAKRIIAKAYRKIKEAFRERKNNINNIKRTNRKTFQDEEKMEGILSKAVSEWKSRSVNNQ